MGPELHPWFFGQVPVVQARLASAGFQSGRRVIQYSVSAVTGVPKRAFTG